MKIFNSLAQLSSFQAQNSITNLGFIPTMGALHDGHLSLIKQSKKENELTICSIFVNPTQFDNPEDLVKYPRLVEQDIEKLEKIGCDFLYLPAVDDLYPHGLQIEVIDLNGLDKEMEGACRKGHFAGVATVVKRLLLQVKPKKAYFGEKDFQQLQIIKQMVRVENLSVEIIGMPIFRESNGLAMSSRNLRLTEMERIQAALLYESLCYAQETYKALPFYTISKKIELDFEKNNLKLEYFSITNEDRLTIEKQYNKKVNYRAFIAAYVGKVRLIDTMKLE